MPRFALADIPAALLELLPSGACLEFPPQGMTADVAVAVGHEQSVVVKRCNHPVYVDWLRREHVVLSALRGAGLPIPDVLGYVEIDAHSARDAWLVMSALAGRSAWNIFLRASSQTRLAILRSVGQQLRRLHATPIPAALKERSNWIERKLTEARTNLAWCDGTQELLTVLVRTQPPQVPEVLIHGDLTLENVLIDEAGQVSLIDWSNAGAGDFRSDVSLALQTEPETSLAPEEVQAFYDGYGTAPVDEQERRWFEQLYEFF